MVDAAAKNAAADWNTMYRSTNQSNNLTPQSDTSSLTAPEAVSNTGVNASETLEQVVTFLDENPGNMYGFPSVADTLSSGDEAIANADLGEFLARPVNIGTFTWAEADAVGTATTFDPWHLFFNNTQIKYKTNNYAFVQCDLKVKVVINASPFYYGAMICTYQPLQSLAPVSYNSIANDAGTRYFIPYSQRPHIWIYPQNNAGGEMHLPFFYNKNWLNLQDADDFTKMGRLTFLNYTTLESANGATGTGVTVQVYAWAENVRLSGPSVGLAMQAKTEYDGPISSVASAIAEAAGKLKRIPLISRFATATEMGAQTLAAGAHALGYTNVPVIDDVKPYRPAAAAPMSTSEVSYPVEKLTLDPMNELSIDPRVVGLSSTDELAIPHLVQRESYLTTASWSTSNVANDILFSSIVTPNMFDNDGATQQKIYMTPMCWLSYMFAQWRGDIIFRFRFVASAYHKGRVRISFDPSGYSGLNVISEAGSTSAVFTTIVDLGKDSNVELRVPYQQALPWLRNNGLPTTSTIPFSTSTSPSFAYDGNYHNGTIVMRVLTALTAPVASSTIKVLVSVRGAENLEFANPVSAFSDSSSSYSYLAPQSRVEDMEDDEVQAIVAGTPSVPSPHRLLVNYGEAITNLRQVLRRASLADVRKLTFSSGNWNVYLRNMGRIPRAVGFDAYGLDSAVGLVTPASNFPYNFCEFHPMTYIAPAFIGVRGSTIWHFNVAMPSTTSSGSVVPSIRITRRPLVAASTSESVTTLADSLTASGFARSFMVTQNGGSAGMALTNQQTQAGLSVLLPMYNNFKFESAAPTNYTYLNDLDGTAYDAFQLELIWNYHTCLNGGFLQSYAGIGTDFNLHFFLNVPTLYKYSAIPTAN